MKIAVFFIFVLMSFQSFAIVHINSDISKSNTVKVETSLTSISSKKDKKEFNVGMFYGYKNENFKILINQKYDYSEIDSEVDADDYFSHLRYIHLGKNNIHKEAFHQYSSYKSRDLLYRKVIGLGLRIESNFSFGIGLIKESDKNYLEETSNSYRMSNYVDFDKEVYNNINLKNILYYQPKLSDFNDYRILNLLTLSYGLSENASLNYNFEIDAYDNKDFSKVFHYRKQSLMLEVKF